MGTAETKGQLCSGPVGVFYGSGHHIHSSCSVPQPGSHQGRFKTSLVRAASLLPPSRLRGQPGHHLGIGPPSCQGHRAPGGWEGWTDLVSRAQKPPACLRRPDYRGSVAAAPTQQNDLLLLKDSCWAHNRTKQPFKTILSYLWIFKPFVLLEKSM